MIEQIHIIHFVSKKKKRNLWDTLIFLINLINYYYYWIPYHWLKLYLFHFIWSKKTFENRKTEEKEPSWRRARINVCSFPACLVSPYVSKKIRMPVVLSFFKGEMERERRGKGGGEALVIMDDAATASPPTPTPTPSLTAASTFSRLFL